ncbi:MAG: pre-peptidase C-terminal domain-containing protein [Thermoguttaceae bacterium]
MIATLLTNIRDGQAQTTSTRTTRILISPARPSAGGFPVRSAAVALVLASLASAVFAASPQLNRITPAGARRGTEVDVQLVGARLGDAAALLLNEPGIEVKDLKPVKDNQVQLRLALAADCPLGPHGIRLRTATGISNLLTFSVGALPEVAEVEPNGDFAAPQAIALDNTVNGVIENEDVDYFVVEAKKGERISVEVEGLRLGETFFDPCVAILAPNRFVLAAADDTPQVRQDAAVALLAPEDGPLIVEVRESSFGGSAQCRYRLHVGRFPRPFGVFPAGGRPGQPIDVQWLGDPKEPWKQTVTLPAAGPQDYSLFASDARGIAPSPNPFRLNELANVLEAEPNNSAAEAARFDGPAALNGVVGQPGDTDFYRFAAKKGQAWHIRVFARQLRSPLDSVLSVLRAQGQGVASNDDSETPDSYVRFAAPEDGEYLVTIGDHLGRGGPLFFYRIEVVPVAPELAVGLREFRSFVDTVVAAPQGNRAAAMVTAQRADFGGELNLAIDGLPDGLACETPPMLDGEAEVPVLFSAAADAPLGGTLARLAARCQADTLKVEATLRQRTSLIRGQNNREIWNYYGDRLPAAVTAPAPFRVEVVQPKVPLVCDGSMDLKVVAHRNAGFAAPITLRMLYNPPGVSSPTSVTIPGDKSEGILPLTANAGAKVRDWPIVVVAQADTGKGEVELASQMAKLAVSPSYFKLILAPTAIEQGAAGQIAVAVEHVKPFEGEATVELVGLPNEVTAEPRKITKDSPEVIFALTTTAKSPPGNHNTVRCRAVVTEAGEPIVHLLGPGELRILTPAPKKTAPAPKPEPAPKTAEVAKPAEKPLSRLEQLRQQRQAPTK